MTKKPKKSGSQAEGSRGSLWRFLPNEPVIVGFDTDDTDHELCQHASNKFDAEHYDEYIAFMRLYGIIKPIVFRRDPAGRILVIDGRTTTRVARVVAPLWEQDRRAQGIKGDEAKLRIPAVVRRGTAEELFCASRGANRRRPDDGAMEEAKDVARLVNAGIPQAQAAVKLGLPLARAKQLLDLLELHPKLQRRVGVDVSLDAAVKLTKFPREQQVAQLEALQVNGARPTAARVVNRIRETNGQAPVVTASGKLKLIASVLEDAATIAVPNVGDLADRELVHATKRLADCLSKIHKIVEGDS